METGVIPIALVCMRMGFRNYFDKVPYRRFLAICTASAVVSMLLLDFAGHNLSLVGAAVCMAGGFGIICSESQAMAMAMVDNTRRSLANNTYLIGLDSGMALGPMIGGFLYGHVAAQYFYPCLIATAVLSTTVYFRSCLKFFLRTFEASFRAGFCRFLRRIAALFYDKNGENVPE